MTEIKEIKQIKITDFFKPKDIEIVNTVILNPCCFCGIEMGIYRYSQYCSRKCLYEN